jgi:hypothetical protein
MEKRTLKGSEKTLKPKAILDVSHQLLCEALKQKRIVADYFATIRQQVQGTI